jgi:hypothetical protein
MENPMVKCSVANCEYWEQGNNCVAETIMIEINAHANKSLPEGSGPEQYDTEHQDAASGVIDTCCHTFVERSH